MSAPQSDSPRWVFKVFAATKAQDREILGDKVTAWLAANPHLEPKKTFVSLSSDSKFHCLSMVLILADRRPA
jgi:hypothetical protein